MDPVIRCFHDDYTRFHGMLDELTDRCPEDLWTATDGEFAYWHHLLHALGCMEHYAAMEGDAPLQSEFTRDVIRFRAKPDKVMSKEALRAYSGKCRTMVEAFFSRQTADTLTDRNPVMSSALGKDQTNQHALIALSRHVAYHVGCCDTLLRSRGLKGVY